MTILKYRNKFLVSRCTLMNVISIFIVSYSVFIEKRFHFTFRSLKQSIKGHCRWITQTWSSFLERLLLFKMISNTHANSTVLSHHTDACKQDYTYVWKQTVVWFESGLHPLLCVIFSLSLLFLSLSAITIGKITNKNIQKNMHMTLYGSWRFHEKIKTALNRLRTHVHTLLHTHIHTHTEKHAHTSNIVILLSGFQWCGLIRKARGRVLSTHHTATFIDSIYTQIHTQHTHELTPIFTTRTGTHNTPLTIPLAPNRFSHFTL